MTRTITFKKVEQVMNREGSPRLISGTRLSDYVLNPVAYSSEITVGDVTFFAEWCAEGYYDNDFSTPSNELCLADEGTSGLIWDIERCFFSCKIESLDNARALINDWNDSDLTTGEMVKIKKWLKDECPVFEHNHSDKPDDYFITRCNETGEVTNVVAKQPTKEK